MNFQIDRLIIWPSSSEFAPQVIPFKLGEVNVITGASRTGKSAIIPIIDYCLASSECYIPIDTIRDHVSWYGVIVQTEVEQILISRKVPVGSKPSNDFFLVRGESLSVPPHITKANENADGVKHILNAGASLPYFGLTGDDSDNESYKSRLSFRDLMALVFQNQDIVANQNILFYKTHAHEHRERLRNWFPYILGVENIQTLAARQRLQTVEKRLNQLRKEFEKTKNISNSWMSNILGHLKIANEYGILSEEVTEETDADELLKIAKELIENIPYYSMTKIENIEGAIQEISKLEIEEVNISNEIGLIKKRLNDLERLKAGVVDFGIIQRKKADRLHISKWLQDLSTESNACPACGSNDHPQAQTEFKKVIAAFKKHEDQSRGFAEIPQSFSREELRIREELQTMLDEKNKLQKRFDLTIARNKEEQEEFHRNRNMYIFLGHLKASIETFESLIDGGDLQSQIKDLEREYNELLGKTDKENDRHRLENVLSVIGQKMLERLKKLDVEETYRKTPPKFSVKDLNISVLSNDHNWHFLAEVGSASNWVSFHLALMCALQEYFTELKQSCVPSFVVFDQPSQVYFPKVRKQEAGNEVVDPEYDNEDVAAVKSIFKTLSESVKSTNGEWQCIILDHADADIYGDIENIHEVVEWRNGKKLIPEEWYT